VKQSSLLGFAVTFMLCAKRVFEKSFIFGEIKFQRVFSASAQQPINEEKVIKEISSNI